MGKVLVGMSGGVDSAVAAFLLKEAGYDVVGITLRTWESDDGFESRCCDIDDARSAARSIGMDFLPVNCTSDFQKSVVDPFISEYLKGKTPNPCIECNRYVKWEKLLTYAAVLGADHVATGHYASVVELENGRYTVKKAKHLEKDQSYMLWKLSQEQLAATLLPLGGYSKSEVRQIAADTGLPIASKPDSQEICFVENGSYADYIEQMAGLGTSKEGFFVDESGKVLGKHKGILHYTIGQRKGLGIALGHPVYVKEIRADSNEVVIGDEQSLYCTGLLCSSPNFMSIPGLEEGESLPCTVKIRYRSAGVAAKISATGEGMVKVSFDEPEKAAAPGQSAVFYDDEGRIIGGGVISEILR